MLNDSDKNNSLEQEISKQIEILDRRFDRNGWFFLVILLIIFFMLVYLFMQVFQVPSNDENISWSEVTEQISSLEERIEHLENQAE